LADIKCTFILFTCTFNTVHTVSDKLTYTYSERLRQYFVEEEGAIVVIYEALCKEAQHMHAIRYKNQNSTQYWLKMQ